MIKKKQAFIFDIDGTLSDASARLHYITGAHKDWDEFYKGCVNDPVIEPVAKVFKTIRNAGYYIILLTGRSEEYITQTADWLNENDLIPNWLRMRNAKDHRPDYIIKQEIYQNEIKPLYDVVGVFEDRDVVVRMWRSLGLRCFQVVDGNF